ncbi:MAG: hypothetical protein Q7S79_03055 [bacterium]|nr:hypothetical protein [bacterium]
MLRPNQRVVFNPGLPKEPNLLEVSSAPTSAVQERKKLDDLLVRKDQNLFQASAIWPFDLFPNELLIDSTKVSFLFKSMLWRETRCVLIKDITDVVVDATPFFATLTVVDRGMIENSVSIRFLNRDVASRARRIIQGLMAAKHEMNIDFARLPLDELKEKLERLGETKLNH